MSDAGNASVWQRHCPVTIEADSECILLAHGEGGRLMRKLIRERIVPRLNRRNLLTMDDAARLTSVDGPIAITTDSYVVSPLFFPGGDIGSLAVYGTVNDLAAGGARPEFITLSLIIEEGLPIAILDRVLQSVADAVQKTDVAVVAGDTKVVPRGAADGLFINTTGVGRLIESPPPGPTSLCEKDALIVTGPIGRHGIAVLTAREEMGFDPLPRSDSAPLWAAVERLHAGLGHRLKAVRDATRGGVAAVLHEWSEASNLTMALEERLVPVSGETRGVCELLGLDPLHVANEGTMVVAVDAAATDEALAVLHTLPETASAARVGTVSKRQVAPVTIRRGLGSEQALDDPSGAPLPRIC